MRSGEPDVPESHRRGSEERTGPGAWLALGSWFVWQLSKSAIREVLAWAASRSSKEQPVPKEPGDGEVRENDRNLTTGSEALLVKRRRWGTLLTGFSFTVSFAGGAGLLVAYWTGSSDQLLGGTLALFLVGWGVGMVLWAHWLTIQKQAVEPREPLDPPEEERKAVRHDFYSGELQRRSLLKLMCVGGSGIAVAFVLSLLRSLGFNPGNTLYSDVWKQGQRLMTEEGKPVTADSLSRGSTMVVFPEGSIGSERAQAVLVRVDENLLHLPSDRSDWAPKGNIAFSRVCTHAGCTVGMYERTVNLLMCPCHQSTFDVLTAAQPTGGPAARPLPQLPLYVDAEGVLRASGGFSEPPGPGFWGMQS